MARCKDKRKVRTKIASHFRNVWKCMDKKILKPQIKKSDFALPSKKRARKKVRRARPLVEEAPVVDAPIVEEAPAPVIEAPALDPVIEVS